MADIWTIETLEDGGYNVIDPQGEIVGTYRDERCARSHHAMALAHNVELRKALQECLHVIEKGIEARMGDEWPAIRNVLPQAVKAGKSALGNQCWGAN